MNIKALETEIISFLISNVKENRKIEQPIMCCFKTRGDIQIEKSVYMYPYNQTRDTVLDIFGVIVEGEAGEKMSKILLQYASEGKTYSDVEFEINPDGSYTSRYWFDEERLYKQEYDLAILRAKGFPHSMANHLVNHQLAYLQTFKRKFERIVWTFWIKDDLPHFELFSINKKNQKLPIELEEQYSKTTADFLFQHYEATNNGILKDVWKPWNKIVISIPPNGYLNENEDIEYYLDDVELEKDFFLRGY